MTYVNLMVHLELGQSNAGLLDTARDLAERFQAGVIGIVACQPLQIAYGDGYVYGELLEQDRQQIDRDMKETRAEFETAFAGRTSSVEWRSVVTYGPLADYLACEARSADLVITGVERTASVFDPSRHVNIGDLVMQAGRPVLIAPKAAGPLKADRMLVGWKETREARRAVADALPLLKRASYVALVEIAEEDGLAAARTHLDDLAGWLKRHGVAAEAMVVPCVGSDVARLGTIADEQRADIVVAGAYGHSRLREWALGGVTRDLLLRPDRYSFVSH